jgi:hypothetical protein
MGRCGDCRLVEVSASPTYREYSLYALKWFFAIVSLGLFTSTLVGIWMGATQTRRTGLAWTLLIVGALVPIGLLVFDLSVMMPS